MYRLLDGQLLCNDFDLPTSYPAATRNDPRPHSYQRPHLHYSRRIGSVRFYYSDYFTNSASGLLYADNFSSKENGNSVWKSCSAYLNNFNLLIHETLSV